MYQKLHVLIKAQGDFLADGLHGPFFKLENLGESGKIARPAPSANPNTQTQIESISNNIEVTCWDLFYMKQSKWR